MASAGTGAVACLQGFARVLANSALGFGGSSFRGLTLGSGVLTFHIGLEVQGCRVCVLGFCVLGFGMLGFPSEL